MDDVGGPQNTSNGSKCNISKPWQAPSTSHMLCQARGNLETITCELNL